MKGLSSEDRGLGEVTKIFVHRIITQSEGKD